MSLGQISHDPHAWVLAQEGTAPVSLALTIGILVLLSLVATLLIAVRFKWIQVSLTSARTTWETKPKLKADNSLAGLSEEMFEQMKDGLISTRETLAAQKQVLLGELDRLREAKGDVHQEAQGYFDAMAELRRSKTQVELLSFELQKLQERARLANEENQRIRTELESQQMEIEQARSQLLAQRAEVERLQADVQREHAEVETALQAIANEWELLAIRKDELAKAKAELFESVAALAKSREQLVAELRAATAVWSRTAE